MADITGTLKVVPIEPDTYTTQQLETLVNKDIKSFEVFFSSMDNCRLSDLELYILRTYLLFKLGKRLKE